MLVVWTTGDFLYRHNLEVRNKAKRLDIETFKTRGALLIFCKIDENRLENMNENRLDEKHTSSYTTSTLGKLVM